MEMAQILDVPRRARAPFGLKAICLAICLASVAPAAFAKNDDGNCNGNCQADPAPAPLAGGSLLGLLVLGGGALMLRRARRNR